MDHQQFDASSLMVELPYLIKPLEIDEDINKNTNSLNSAIEQRLVLCCCVPLRCGIAILFVIQFMELIGICSLIFRGLPSVKANPFFYLLFAGYAIIKPLMINYIIRFWRNDSLINRYYLFRVFDMWIASEIYFQIVYGFLLESINNNRRDNGSGGLIFSIIFTVAFIWPQRKEVYRFYECGLRVDKKRDIN